MTVLLGLVFAIAGLALMVRAARPSPIADPNRPKWRRLGRPAPPDASPPTGRLSRLDLLVSGLYALLLGGAASGAILLVLADQRLKLEQLLPFPSLLGPRAQSLSLVGTCVAVAFLGCVVWSLNRPPRRFLGPVERCAVALAGLLGILIWGPLLLAIFD